MGGHREEVRGREGEECGGGGGTQCRNPTF